jgi:hypothetical protein
MAFDYPPDNTKIYAVCPIDHLAGYQVGSKGLLRKELSRSNGEEFWEEYHLGKSKSNYLCDGREKSFQPSRGTQEKGVHQESG